MDIATETSFLFVPHYDEYYATWIGEVPTLKELKELYGVDEALYRGFLGKDEKRYKKKRGARNEKERKKILTYFPSPTEDLALTLEVLSQNSPNSYPIYTLPGLETAMIPSNYSTEDESLLPILWEQRNVKSALEIDLLKVVFFG